MTNAIWIRDLGAFSVQVAALVFAGAAVAFLCRLQQPRAMLLFWRLLLFVCLALPFCQPWHASGAPPNPHVTVLTASAMPVAAAATVPTSAPPSRSSGEVLILLLIAGAAVRAAWLAMGALAIRRLRRGAAPLAPMPPGIREAQLRVGARGDILVSDRATGPMTFGLFRPVVLLPADVGEMAPHIQEAIAYHELIHVRRRDWINELFEEGVRTILWFHPAVWWLIGRIRLSREQVVDEAVIRFTQSRERYVDALLVVALRKSPMTLAPAPTFLRRSLLKARVLHIMQESTMTTYRLIASLTTSAIVVGLAAVFAVRSFPLQAQSRAAADTGAPVQVAKGGEHLLHGSLPEYPARAIEQRVEGDVLLDLAIDDRGEVADARVSSGPDELRRASLESVLQWHYAPTAVSNRSTQVTLRFHLPPPGAESGVKWALDGTSAKFVTPDGRTFQLRNNGELATEPEGTELSSERIEHMMAEMRGAIASPETSAAEKEVLANKYADVEKMLILRRLQDVEVAGKDTGIAVRSPRFKLEPEAEGPLRLAQIRTERVADEWAAEILARTGLKIGDTVSEEQIKQVRAAAASVDEHVRVEFGRDERGVVLTFIAR
jgi:TonB family protein